MNQPNELYEQEASGETMSVWQKLLDVLLEPSKVFQAIRERVSWQDWVIPMLIIVLVSGTVSIINARQTMEFTRQMMQTQQQQGGFGQGGGPPGAGAEDGQMPPQFDPEQRFSSPRGYLFAYGGSLVRIALSILILASLYFFAGNTILGGKAAFPQLLAVVALPQMVTVLQNVYNTLYLQLISNPSSPQAPSSLAVLLPYGMQNMFQLEAYQRGLLSVLSQIDVFTIWRLLLYSIGFAAVYKFSKAKANGVVFGYWGVLLVLSFAGSFLMAGMFQ